MVTIRMARAGARNAPYFHVSVCDSRAPRDGRFIERIGFVNPIARGQAQPYRLDLERYEYWRSQGALPSDRVRQLVKRVRRDAVRAAVEAEAEEAAKDTVEDDVEVVATEEDVGSEELASKELASEEMASEEAGTDDDAESIDASSEGEADSTVSDESEAGNDGDSEEESTK